MDGGKHCKNRGEGGGRSKAGLFLKRIITKHRLIQNNYLNKCNTGNTLVSSNYDVIQT